jgi:hypothetical protein
MATRENPRLAVLALRFDCDVLILRVEWLDGGRFWVTVSPASPHLTAAAIPSQGDKLGMNAIGVDDTELIGWTVGDDQPPGLLTVLQPW